MIPSHFNELMNKDRFINILCCGGNFMQIQLVPVSSSYLVKGRHENLKIFCYTA
jgi:hypothetical protein